MPTATTEGIDPDRRLRLSPRVGLRPEPFGALAYHFDTRRLVFLKAPELVGLVRDLDAHPTVGAAVAATGATPARQRSYLTALASLHDAGVVEDAPSASTDEAPAA